jgi:transglutaminase-like putative cysteine protease
MSSPTLDKITVSGAPNGENATRKTLEIMKSLVTRSVAELPVREFANEIRSMSDSDYGRAVALYNTVKSRIRYVSDPPVDEWLQTADLTLQNNEGDCDDMAVLIAAVAVLLGIPVRFEAVGFNRYEHVIAQLQVETPSTCEDCGSHLEWLTIDPVPTSAVHWSKINKRMSLVV